MPGIKIKEVEDWLDRITSNLVLPKHIDGSDTQFDSLSETLSTNQLDKWLVVISIRRYQQEGAEKGWYYGLVKTLWIETVIESDLRNDYESSEGSDYE